MTATYRPFVAESEPAGILRHEGRTYFVHRLTDAGSIGSGNAVALVKGKRDAEYLIVDNGPKFRPTAYNVSGKSSVWNKFVMSTPFTKSPLRRADLMAVLGNA